MKILFDYISIQGRVNGGAEYTKVILSELVKYKKQHTDIYLYALYDSKELRVHERNLLYAEFFDGFFDVRSVSSIGRVIEKERIDTFFIGILQKLLKYDLSNIRCRVVAVLHDIASFEIRRSRLYLLKPLNYREIIKLQIKKILSPILSKYRDSDSLFEKNRDIILMPNFNIVTVSEFSKNSIRYNLPFLKEKHIHVFYSPLRSDSVPQKITEIEAFKKEGVNFFLILSSDRWLKNSQMALDVLKLFCEENSHYYVVTTGKIKKQFNNHIPLSYVSNEELAYLLKNAYALIYPTLFEGFGYPPLEAMRYGTPVLCSGFASLPEVVGNAGIIFSPLFRSDLYNKIYKFIQTDRKTYSERSKIQYECISKRQQMDLISLMNLIINDN